MQPIDQAAASPPLREYLDVLRSRKWSIFAITALTVAAALAVSYHLTPMYSSTAKVLVKPVSVQQQIQGTTTTTDLNLDTETQLVESTSVASLAARKMR